MRLICPNCDAHYEVDDAAIPMAGRDVQCSNCGNAWFQLPPEVEAEKAAEAALHDAPEGAADIALPHADADAAIIAAISVQSAPDRTVIAPLAEAPPLPPVTAAAQFAPTAPTAPASPAGAASPVQRQIDDSILAVLREEAEREMIARRLDAQALETQGELGIDAAIAATVQQNVVPRRPMPAAYVPDIDADPDPLPDPAYTGSPGLKRELTRREMLPDIEEINSSLRPGDVAVDDAGTAYEIARRPEPGRSSFRSGFVLMLVIGLIGLLAYVMAPQISAQIPAVQPAMDSYVQTVDAGRLWLDGATRGLVTSLRGMAGNDSP